ncbi:carboxypeptidase-like regulatory domain-containing protein [uncultured Croceitalea sp.]|uniref:carboxypeptidase-like regulatory domain-containing protein n=1 Tax=uncultured Croceitalea sp. TaxID=1798908 RepID=UPI003306272E
MRNFRFNTILFIAFLLANFSLKGQSSKISKGKVVAKDKDVTGVVVQNITNKKTTITDVNGNFSIQISLNDTLVFSAVQFKRKAVSITKSFYNSSFITVPLEEFVNELREVVVQPFNLSGNLNSDLSTIKLEKDVSAEALGLPNADVRIITQSENKLNDADHGKFAYYYVIALTINLNKVLNRLSGRTKMLKERVALDKRYKTTQKIEAAFVDSLLVNHLKIPRDNFYEFIQFCESDSVFYNLAQGSDELKLWEFLIQKSAVYRENNELD